MIRTNLRHAAIALLVQCSCFIAQADIISTLTNDSCYTSRVEYEIMMPNADDPVRYDITLVQQSAAGDSLSPCKYLIVSKPININNSEDSFSAYFDGNFFRYRANRLDEWHYADEPEWFDTGTQCNEMFTSLLPAFIARNLSSMTDDASFDYNIEQDGDISVIRGEENRNGYLCQSFVYRFNDTGQPVSLETVNAPDTPTEQTMTARYTYPDNNQFEPLSEDLLSRMFPEAFDKFRKEKFNTKNLIGKPFPTFSSQTLSRERLSHTRGERFGISTLFVILRKDDSRTIEEIRETVKTAGKKVNLVYVFSENDFECVSQTVGSLTAGEEAIMNAKSLIRDCGIREYPTVILCDSDGIILGCTLNNDAGNDVIELLTENV